MRCQQLAITCLTWMAMNSWPVWFAAAGEKGDSGSCNLPREFVEGTGWHALGSASYACGMNGDQAACDSYRGNEAQVVETAASQDTANRLAQAQCSDKHSCAADQAPDCTASKYGQYEVDNVTHDWGATISYHDWCGPPTTRR